MTKLLLSFIIVFLLINNTYSQNADINLLRKINPVNPASSVWIGVTNSAYPITIGVQGGLMAYDYFKSDSTRGLIIRHIAEKLIVVAVTETVKYIINRPRPYVTYPGLVHPYETSETGLSLPSAQGNGKSVSRIVMWGAAPPKTSMWSARVVTTPPHCCGCR